MMKKLLHIIATPRKEESRTLKVSNEFLGQFKKKYPDCRIDELNVSTEPLPSLTVKMIFGKYILLSGGQLTEKVKDIWSIIERYIEQFLSADTYLISTPMWNFSIPYMLKQYIDIIVQPKYLFQYTDKGAQGLVKNKKMVVVSSRGGDYSGGSPYDNLDFQEAYLRAIFGFVGIEENDITFINAQPMDMGEERRLKSLEAAKAEAIRAANERC
jgi:FMN-dependent NADH-azoreductase